MQKLSVVWLGNHYIVNPDPGEPAFLSAASGAAWSPESDIFYAVGDDQASVAEFRLYKADVETALRTGRNQNILDPGYARRILPGVLPIEEKERKNNKADFEALCIIRLEHIKEIADPGIRGESRRLFPNGLMMIAGSGGVSWQGNRRSIGVVNPQNFVYPRWRQRLQPFHKCHLY